MQDFRGGDGGDGEGDEGEGNAQGVADPEGLPPFHNQSWLLFFSASIASSIIT